MGWIPIGITGVKMDKRLHKILKEADQDRVEGYMNMFDRVLLYTLATNTMPSDALKETIELWDKVVKNSINFDAIKRTNTLENSTIGRAAKLHKEPDGECLRLHYLKQWKIARKLIVANLQSESEDDVDFSV